MKTKLSLAILFLISFYSVSAATADNASENKTSGSKTPEMKTAGDRSTGSKPVDGKSQDNKAADNKPPVAKTPAQLKAEAEVNKAIKRLNPAKFCKYEFEGLGNFDYKKFPTWKELGLASKLANKLEYMPYADNATPVVEKDGSQDGLLRLDKGLLGLQKKDGTVVLPPIYDYMEYPQASKSKWILCCIKERFNEKTDKRTADFGFRFMGKDGKEMSKQRFKNAFSFNEGRAAVLIEGKGWGFIDETGKMVIPCHYDTVRSFCEGLATVATGYMWGYTDLNGNDILAPIFEANTNFKNGYAKVRFDGLWGVLKKSQLSPTNKSSKKK